MALEYARHAAGLAGAAHAESDPDGETIVVEAPACSLVGQERLGLTVGAHADDAGVEAFELPDHPFYLATLFQPQVGTSERGVLHPLVGALRAAAASGAPILSR
jgi:CTP synthase (UTP-ammonia lyase)